MHSRPRRLALISARRKGGRAVADPLIDFLNGQTYASRLSNSAAFDSASSVNGLVQECY